MDTKAIEAAARSAIAPLLPAPVTNPYFTGDRTKAGYSLPPYYLVYFLLVELLGFDDSGPEEKVAWSVPVDYKGRRLTIEHRKLGLGIFSHNAADDEEAAVEVANRIHAGVKAAEPFFDLLAETAARGSRLNVVNNSPKLFERFEFLATQYESKRLEANAREKETIRTRIEDGYIISYPSSTIRRHAQLYAVSAIEAFFSWTEHVFIHLGIITGRLLTGDAIPKLADANWADKYKIALDLSDGDSKNFYDRLLVLRRQLRNFVAHGSFGKEGQAFQFHSSVGAVPLLLPHRRGADSFKFGNGVDFVAHDAIALIHDFIRHLWSQSRAPAKIYIQDNGLPLVLGWRATGRMLGRCDQKRQ